MTPQEAFNKVYDTITEVAPNIEGPTEELLLLISRLADLLADEPAHRD